MMKSIDTSPNGFRKARLVEAVQHALLAMAFGGGLLAISTEVAGRSGDTSAAFASSQVIRQFTLRNTVAQANQILQSQVVTVSGKSRGVAMGAPGAFFPASLGTVPSGFGIPQRDGNGRPMGYCAWDNNTSSDTASYRGGSGMGTQLVYAVVSPGLNGAFETSCDTIEVAGAAAGDDYLELRLDSNAGASQFGEPVATVADLATTPGSAGDVRLVLENNRLYSFVGGAWQAVASTGSFVDDSATNGANALAYTLGKVTVADFQATTAALSSNLSVSGTSTLTGVVTASNGVTVSSGGLNVTGNTSITGATTITGNTTVNGTFTATNLVGNASGLTDLNASNINAGVLGTAYGGTGVNAGAAANGALLIGNGSGFALGGLTGTADQVNVSNGPGTIVLSLPQNIATTSTPTFGGLMLNGALTGVAANFTGAVGASRLNVLDAINNVIVGTDAFPNPHATSNDNVVIGHLAMQNASASYAENNVVVGSRALVNAADPYENTVVGDRALSNATSSLANVAIGTLAMYGGGDAGTGNVAVGNYTMYTHGGNYNTALGFAALELSTGSYNTAVGDKSLAAGAGSSNSALGRYAGWATSTGDDTNANITGSNNTYLGAYAMPGTTTQLNYSTAIGSDSRVTTSNTVVLGRTSDTTVIGATGTASSGILQNKILQVTGDVGISGALTIGGTFTATGFSGNGSGLTDLNASNISTGTLAVARGGTGLTTAPTSGQLLIGNSSSGYTLGTLTGTANQVTVTNASGSITLSLPQNIATTSTPTFGGMTLNGALAGTTATFTGAVSALRLDVSDSSGGVTNSNLAVGTNALGLAQSGNGANSAIGIQALFSNTSGERNTAVGRSSLYSNTTGSENNAFGRNALNQNTTGDNNSAFGAWALTNASIASENSAFGSDALASTTTGSQNTAMGFSALNGNLTGSQNVAVGLWTLAEMTAGDFNLALGAEAGSRSGTQRLVTGNNNSFVGSYSGPTSGVSTLNYATAIGSYAEVGTDNTIVLGRTSDTTVIGATGTATSGILQNKKLQVTGDVGVSGALAIGGAFTTTGRVTGAGLQTTALLGLTDPNPGPNAIFQKSALDIAVDGGITGTMNSTDFWYIGRSPRSATHNSVDNGGLYFMTGDNKNEPIIFGQFNFNESMDSARYLTLMDASGNTTLAGNLTVPGNASVTGNLSLTGNLNGYSFKYITAGVSGASMGIGVDNFTATQTGGGENLAVGLNTMRLNTSGERNTAVGSFALENNTTGSDNAAFGHRSLSANTTGNANTAFGDSTLRQNTIGYENVAVGENALRENTEGWKNTAIGQDALYNNTTGNRNTAIGQQSMRANLTGILNTAVGENTLSSNTTGNRNVAIAPGSMMTNTTGYDNVAVGHDTLKFSVDGHTNVAVGREALMTLTTGRDNIAIGGYAINDATSGDRNTIVGANGASDQTTASFNSGLGFDTLRRATSGGLNTAVGAYSLDRVTTGERNTALGYGAGANSTNGVTTGSYNTFLGFEAQPGTSTQLEYATAIGASARITTSNTVVLGRTTDTTVIGAAGTASSGILQNKILQVTGNAGISGTLDLGGALSGTTASFSGAVTALRLNIADSSGGVPDANMAVGTNALTGAQSGAGANVAVGPNALNANTSGSANVALGRSSMISNTTGSSNTGLGRSALNLNVSGNNNVGVGFNVLHDNLASNNTAVGYSALRSNTTGDSNTALGREAGFRSAAGSSTNATVSGSYNTFLGANATQGNIATLSYATVIGADSRVTTSNTVVLGRTSDVVVIGATGDNGSGARLQVTGNIAGTRIAVNDTTGGLTFGNTIVGPSIMTGAQSGTGGSVAVGEFALRDNTSGYYNVALGGSAMAPNTTGYENVAVGVASMYSNTTGNQNTAVGRRSLYSNISGVTNVAVGYESLMFSTTANDNTAVGSQALRNATTGGDNAAVGEKAMYTTTTGYQNSVLGAGALEFNTEGFGNIAVGYHALENNTTGDRNVALGRNSLGGITTSNDNVAMGEQTLLALTSGSRNLALGTKAGYEDSGGSITNALTNGDNNTFLGSYATPGTTSSISFATAIGSNSKVSTSDTIVLGRTSDRVVIGATGAATSGVLNGGTLQVTGTIRTTGNIFMNGSVVSTSDYRLKNSITQLDTDDVLRKLAQMKSYAYRLNLDPKQEMRIGVVAQEVATLFPEISKLQESGYYGVDYGALGALAAAGVGRLSMQFDTLNNTVTEQGKEITVVKTRLDEVDKRVVSLEGWKTEAVGRMDKMQSAIDLNIEKIAANALAIASNTEKITTLEQITQQIDSRLLTAEGTLAKVDADWNSSFSRSEDGQTLTVKTPNLVASNFSAEQIRARAAYTERLEAEMAKIRMLEVDSLKANTAVARNVQAETMNTGSAQVYAGVGNPALLFSAPTDGHYTVNTSALDGSYATATVIVNAGQAKVVTVASEGIELIAVGSTVKAVAAGKSIRASWIKMG